MTNAELALLIDDLVAVANRAQVILARSDLEVEFTGPPHVRPSRLPFPKQAVYGFLFSEHCLKVGKAGPSSEARYTSQHYNAKSSGSNLAKSLLKAAERLQGKVPVEVMESVRSLTGNCAFR